MFKRTNKSRHREKFGKLIYVWKVLKTSDVTTDGKNGADMVIGYSLPRKYQYTKIMSNTRTNSYWSLWEIMIISI